MRFPLGFLSAGLVAAQMLAAPLASAECVRPADHASLDVAALKSSLMVTALTCDAGDKYNAFIRKYQPELSSQERALSGYFSRANSRNARKQQDDYVTNLANSRSQDGTRRGSLYCAENLPVFDEVMALRSGTELVDYRRRQVGEPADQRGRLRRRGACRDPRGHGPRHPGVPHPPRLIPDWVNGTRKGGESPLFHAVATAPRRHGTGRAEKRQRLPP